jgi:tRNA-binding EMAP/Myf-like protein
MLFFSTALVGAERHKAMPSQFVGEWSTDLKYCGTDLSDSRLIISANKIRFYESEGPILAVITQGKSTAAIIMELSGEGETWLSSKHFSLSTDQSKLTDTTDDLNFVRYRCKNANK